MDLGTVLGSVSFLFVIVLFVIFKKNASENEKQLKNANKNHGTLLRRMYEVEQILRNSEK